MHGCRIKSKWRIKLLCAVLLAAGLGCYYDANPPDESLIHDEKPLLMLDINLGAGVTQKSIQIKFTDAFGSTTLEGASLKTDATGRLLYPLRMQHGTRGYTLDSIIVDQSGQGTFAEAADLTWDKIASPPPFVKDDDELKFRLERTAFTPP